MLHAIHAAIVFLVVVLVVLVIGTPFVNRGEKTPGFTFRYPVRRR